MTKHEAKPVFGDEDPAIDFFNPPSTSDKAPPTPEAPESRTPEPDDSDDDDETPVPGPRYIEFERVDGRLRADQLAALNQLRRQVTRGRRNRSERITANTLLRVAVDLLLAHGDRLRGDTEAELAQSALRATRRPRRPAS